MDRKLFWTDRGSDNGVPPKVASADMDGGNLKNLFTDNLVNVGYITTDISASKLYWGVASTGVVCSCQGFRIASSLNTLINIGKFPLLCCFT